MNTVTVDGVTLVNVHPARACAAQKHCVVHKQSDHHMRSWTLLWRSDRGIFERLCEHGVGHPDPDQSEFWEATGQTHNQVHGCDGCCAPEPTEKEIYAYRKAQAGLAIMKGQFVEVGSMLWSSVMDDREVIEDFEARYGKR